MLQVSQSDVVSDLPASKDPSSLPPNSIDHQSWLPQSIEEAGSHGLIDMSRVKSSQVGELVGGFARLSASDPTAKPRRT